MFQARTLLAAGAILLGAASVHADYEAQLLEKFQKQNKNTAEKWKQDVEESLAKAGLLRTADPEHGLKILDKTLAALEKDTGLLGKERGPLAQRLRDEMAKLRESAAERKREEDKRKLEEARAELAKTSPGAVSGRSTSPTFPGADPRLATADKPTSLSPFVALPSAASAQVTPVVGPGRRWVRIGVNASFLLPRPNFIAVPVATPTILQGPGRGITVMPPVVVKSQLVPVPGFVSGNINTTVMAPDGGTAVLGGYNSSFMSRAEFGPPVLSGIPYVNRLFRNTGYGVSSSGFRIGVSPRIIIMEEEEQRFLGNLP
jgi:hypothetical protein